MAHEEKEMNVISHTDQINLIQPSYAGFWVRAGAYILDAFAIIGISFVLGLVMMLFGIAVGVSVDLFEDEGAWNLFIFLVTWIYFAGMESSAKQATWGKRALGLKVTDLEGNRMSFARATGRYFGKIVSYMLIFIGFIMVAFTKRKQGLHDMMAGCLVVNK
ncbi:RDD family protein [Thiomicrospira microaerophila]|uniref:RDD family protein n=1 Tax=Thiomicrospira microaerophila TaxID=406020 RepID=UPI0018E08E6C|nr:RDD family protein [Thiomicrospira microaerophila]